MEDEYCVRIVDLPPGVHGFVALDHSGFANIYLNAHDSAEEQRVTFEHELTHIRRGDAYTMTPIDVIERCIR